MLLSVFVASLLSVSPAESPETTDAWSLPIRAVHRISLSGETGLNSLAGFGGMFSVNVLPALSFDIGLGQGRHGPKGGVRARWNILERAWTPYLGAGYIAASYTEPGSGFDHYIQMTTGLSYVAERGLTLLFSGGWAHHVGGLATRASGADWAINPNSHGSGFVGSAAVGYSF